MRFRDPRTSRYVTSKLGKKIGCVEVLEFLRREGRKNIFRCLCDCGEEREISSRRLIEHNPPKWCSKYCALSRKPKTHGMTHTPQYAVYRSMLARCNNPNHQAYHNYGARGIKVCKRWESFKAFWEDMGPTYEPGLTLDRLDNDKGYSPSNCAWRTWTEQNRNRRDSRFSPEILDEAARLGIGHSTLLYRASNGWPEHLWLIPPDKRNRCSTLLTAGPGTGS